MKRFNVLHSPFLRRACLGFVFLLCCAAAALAWFAPPQSAFAFLTSGETSQPKQTVVSPIGKSDAGKQTSAQRQQQDSEKKSQDGVWHEVQLDSLSGSFSEGVPEKARALKLNSTALRKILDSAPADSAEKLTDVSKSGAILQLPMPDGGFMRFRIVDSPVLNTDLVKQFPDIKSYRGQSIDDPRVSMRADFSPRGFNATILTADKMISINPARYDDINRYVSYYGGDFNAQPFSCGVKDSSGQQTEISDLITSQSKKYDLINEDAPGIATGATLRKYRLAIATTYEYYIAPTHGNGSYGSTVATLNTWVSALNAIYERELAIRFILVTNTNIVFTDPNDGLTEGNPGLMHEEIQPILETKVGLNNYDIGHVLGKDGIGGVAKLGVTCRNDKLKGGGATGVYAPMGNAFGLQVFAHEIGHQFGAPHTWNACGASGGRSTVTSYEVGSGSTIMSYNGICGSDNLVGGYDYRFHSITLKVINSYLDSAPACAVTEATGNDAPVVDAGANYTVPKLTPFALTASATDANGDVPNLTYTWEQFDNGGSLYPNPPYDDSGDPLTTTRPIFRAYSPTSNPTRVFPSLTYILNNANEPPDTIVTGSDTRRPGEKLPRIGRTMNFRVTARDNRSGAGGTNDDTMVLTVDGNSGPFGITAPNTAASWTGGGTQTVTWNVNNTNVAPVNAQNVKISLSTDGGNTFPTVLAASTANDGSEMITVPNGIQTATARIKIEAVGNIFFDISDANFTINTGDSCPVINSITPSAGSVGTAITITGINFTGVTTVTFSGGVNAPILAGSNDTQINVTVPAGATSGAITLSKPGCGDRQSPFFSVCASAPQTLSIDDGAIELVHGDKFYINRLTPPSYPATLTHVQVFWYGGNGGPAIGQQTTILAGTNTDGDQNINNTAFQAVPATVDAHWQFRTYALTTPITITSGDFLVGYNLPNGGGVSDNSAPDSRSYYSADGVSFGLATNTDYMIRALYSTGCDAGTAISPGSQNFNAAGGNGSIAVTAQSAWTAASNNGWITINSGASGTGNGTVVYSVAQNNTGAQRSGTITIAGQTFTVTQDACAVGFAPSSVTHSSGGGNFTVNVSAPAGCGWTAASNSAWITINAGASGSGDGTISYTVSLNTVMTQRTGSLTIAGQTLNVTQNACPDSSDLIYDDEITSGGGSGGYNVVRMTPPSYPATLTHVQIYLNNSWGATGRSFNIIAGKNTDGDENIVGSIQQTVAVNSGTERNKYVSFALTTPITITQGDFVVGFQVPTAGGFFPLEFETVAPTGRSYWSGDNGATFNKDTGADYKIRGQYQTYCQQGSISAISPPNYNNSGGSGTVNIRATGAWSAHSNNFWITVTSGTSGNGILSYTVAPNDTGEARTGTITIAGQVFVIYQAGSGRSIAGKVVYGINNTKTVPSVTLTATGGSGFETATSLSGAYLIPGLIEEENYTVTPSKTTDVNGITAFDATLVLRCVAAGQNCALTQNQRTAANTDGDAGVTAFDATQILRFVAANGSNANTGQVGAWKFELPSRTYHNLTTDPTGQDYTAFLKGDVDGDWQHPDNSAGATAAVQEAGQKQRLPEVGLSFSGKAGKQADNTQTIPVSLTNHSSVPVSAFSFDVTFNEKIRQPLDMSIETTGTLAEGCAVTANTDIAGRIGVAGACPDSIKVAAGTLLNLRFTAPSIRSKSAQILPELAFSQAPVIQDNEGNRIALIKTN